MTCFGHAFTHLQHALHFPGSMAMNSDFSLSMSVFVFLQSNGFPSSGEMDESRLFLHYPRYCLRNAVGPMPAVRVNSRVK